MTITWELLSNEPVLVATLSGEVTSQQVEALYAHSAQLVEKVGGHLYRIMQLDTPSASFKDILMLLANTANDQPGSSTDLNLTDIFLASESLPAATAPGTETPMFRTLDDALTFARYDLGKRVTQEVSKLPPYESGMFGEENQ